MIPFIFYAFLLIWFLFSDPDPIDGEVFNNIARLWIWGQFLLNSIALFSEIGRNYWNNIDKLYQRGLINKKRESNRKSMKDLKHPLNYSIQFKEVNEVDNQKKKQKIHEMKLDKDYFAMAYCSFIERYSIHYKLKED